MKELLLRYGYEFTGNCNCDGHATEKYYRNGDQYTLRVRTKQNSFKIKHRGYSLTAWASINSLMETLNNIHATVPA